jgi:hypothetical protein
MEDREIFDLAAKHIYSSFLSKNKIEERHALDTLKYLKMAYPNPPCALTVAAYSHDVERTVNDSKNNKKSILANNSYKEHKNIHAVKSASLVFSLLSKIGLDKKIVSDISYIIVNHEYGPKTTAPAMDSYSRSYDINLAVRKLMNSDARAFFEEHSMKKYLADYGKISLVDKIVFSYSRLNGAFRQEVCSLDFRDKNIEKIIRETIRFQFRS